MGFRDRLAAEEARQREHAERMDSAARQSEEERIEHVKMAEALMPEVDEAVALLRSLQDGSVRLLPEEDQMNQYVCLRWADEDGNRIVSPAQGASSKERRRWSNRRLAGWVAKISGGGFARGPGQIEVFIPLDGDPLVETQAPSASGPLREYIRGGRWEWRQPAGGHVTVDLDEKADKTVEVLLSQLARHIAELR
jgi:hypothetical protein